MKRAPHTTVAFNPDVAIHHLYQSFGNRQPQARAAVFSGSGTVSLAEGLEQAGCLLRSHADPTITDRKLQIHSAESLFHE